MGSGDEFEDDAGIVEEVSEVVVMKAAYRDQAIAPGSLVEAQADEDASGF